MSGFKPVSKWCFAAALVLAICAPSAAFAQDSGDEARWPLQLDATEALIIIYQPQFESYKGNILEARAAVSVTIAGSSEAMFGAMWFEARMSTDLDARTISCLDLKVTAAKFPTLDGAQVEKLSGYLEREVPEWEMIVDLDEFLATVDAAEVEEGDAATFNNDPPEMIFSEIPAVLVMIDGDPKLADMEGYNLQYVANTPFFIALDPGSKQYYLRGDNYWYSSGNVMGPWTATEKLPSEVAKVSKAIDEEVAQDKAEQAEGETPEDEPEDAGDSGPPAIIVRTDSAELVLTDGEPKFAPLEGTQLLYVENTETDILMDLASQTYYLLVSGRWYTAGSLENGEWKYVEPGKVPADFANIGADTDMGQVLANVPGTMESKEAVLENTIPQTAEVDRKTATTTVTYDGDPQFQTCSDAVAYAVNTDKAVFLIAGEYYCCDEAVWYRATGPSGPWQAATAVPPEIQDLPADCPHYNVKYVYIYDTTPETVYVGYTPAYTCSYVSYGTVVYGTGYYYQPWYHTYYYPRPVTWGFHAHYNPWTGWGFSYGASFGWLHIRVGRPWYGGWWGPGGYRHGYRHGYGHGYQHGYHHGARAGYRAGYKAGNRSSHRNMYKAQQHKGVQAGGRPSTQPARKPKTSNQKNNVYAGKGGDVHRNQGGNWQTKDKSGWSNSSKQNNQSMDKQQQSRQRSQQKSSQSRSRSGGGGRGRR